VQIQQRLQKHTVLVALGAILLTSLFIGATAYLIVYKNFTIFTQDRLSIIRDLKKEQIESYFTLMKKQVLTFSDDKMMIEALEAFKKTFNLFSEELGQKAINGFNQSLVTAYQQQSGLSPDTIKKLFVHLNENTFALQYQYIFANAYPLGQKDRLDFSNDNSSYSKVHSVYHALIKEFQEKFGFYDILLVDSDTGYVIYSASKELDFATSLVNGPFSTTPLGQVFALANAATINDYTVLSDFSEYEASQNKMSAFLTTPIFKNNKKIGVLIFQIPLKPLDDMVTESHQWVELGLQESGEFYIVGQNKKLRTENRLFIENPTRYLQSVKPYMPAELINNIFAKKSTVGLQEVFNEGALLSLQGKKGFGIYNDYKNEAVFTAFTPLAIGGLTWGLVCTESVNEARVPLKILCQQLLFGTLIVSIVLMGIAYGCSRRLGQSISLPIQRLSQEITNIAYQKDLSHRITLAVEGELADMVQAVNFLMQNFELICREAQSSSIAMKSTVAQINQLTSAMQRYEQDNKKLDEQPNIYQTPESSFATMENIIKAAQDLNDFSDRLSILSTQFQFIEDEAEKKEEW